jgi:anti-sigma B factor antagonist
VHAADAPALRITSGDGGALRLAGELDLATGDLLRERLAELVGADRLVVDLAGLEFVDVTGLNVLLDAHRAQRERGCALVVRRPRPMVLRMLTLLRLDGELEIEP